MRRRSAVLLSSGILLAFGGPVLPVPGAEKPAHASGVYRDPVCGFVLEPPVFPEPKKARGDVLVFQKCAPREREAYSHNLQVQVRFPGSTRQVYRKDTLAQLEKSRCTVASDKDLKVSGKDALLMEYEGTEQGRKLRYLSLAVFEEGRILRVTCTAGVDVFPGYEQAFRDALRSVTMGREPASPSPTAYVNPQYGFSLEPPAFPEGVKGEINLFVVYAPPRNGFSSSLCVQAQFFGRTREQYRESGLAEFKRAGIAVVSDKDLTVSGKDAILIEYEDGASVQGQRFHCLALAVFQEGRVLVTTCTAPAGEFQGFEKTFRASLESFRLEGALSGSAMP